MELPLPPPGCNTTPPSGSGIISRPLSSGPIVPPLVDWQAVPFEIMNPSLTAPHGGAFASSLNFRRCDQDLMFQAHPSLCAPINLPFADLSEPADATSLYPPTPESGSDANVDELSVPEDRHPTHGLLSETERSASNSDSNSLGSNNKNGFWNTVLCPSHHGQSNSSADVLEFIPAARPDIVPVPPLPSPRRASHLFPVEEFGQPSLLSKLPIFDTPRVEEKPPDQMKQKQEKKEVQQAQQERQDRPYECNQCGLRFRKRCNAINHTKIVRKSHCVIHHVTGFLCVEDSSATNPDYVTPLFLFQTRNCDHTSAHSAIERLAKRAIVKSTRSSIQDKSTRSVFLPRIHGSLFK